MKEAEGGENPIGKLEKPSRETDVINDTLFRINEDYRRAAQSILTTELPPLNFRTFQPAVWNDLSRCESRRQALDIVNSDLRTIDQLNDIYSRFESELADKSNQIKQIHERWSKLQTLIMQAVPRAAALDGGGAHSAYLLSLAQQIQTINQGPTPTKQEFIQTTKVSNSWKKPSNKRSKEFEPRKRGSPT